MFFLFFTSPVLMRQPLDEIGYNNDDDSGEHGQTEDLPGFFPVFCPEFRLHYGLGFADLGSEIKQSPAPKSGVKMHKSLKKSAKKINRQKA